MIFDDFQYFRRKTNKKHKKQHLKQHYFGQQYCFFSVVLVFLCVFNVFFNIFSLIFDDFQYFRNKAQESAFRLKIMMSYCFCDFFSDRLLKFGVFAYLDLLLRFSHLKTRV